MFWDNHLLLINFRLTDLKKKDWSFYSEFLIIGIKPIEVSKQINKRVIGNSIQIYAV